MQFCFFYEIDDTKIAAWNKSERLLHLHSCIWETHLSKATYIAFKAHKLHKEWTEAGVSASRVTTLRRLQEKGYQATSEPETTSEASYLGCGEK